MKTIIIVPAFNEGKTILGVPGGLAVAQQDDFLHDLGWDWGCGEQ